MIQEELLEFGILFAQIKTRNICGLEGREPRSKWDVNSRIDRALHTMQRPALMRLLYFRQPNVILNAAVGQELVPKSGIDGGYIGVRYHHISDLSAPPSILLSLSGPLVEVGRTVSCWDERSIFICV